MVHKFTIKTRIGALIHELCCGTLAATENQLAGALVDKLGVCIGGSFIEVKVSQLAADLSPHCALAPTSSMIFPLLPLLRVWRRRHKKNARDAYLAG